MCHIVFNFVCFFSSGAVHSLGFSGFAAIESGDNENREQRAAGKTQSEQMKAFKGEREEGRRLR